MGSRGAVSWLPALSPAKTQPPHHPQSHHHCSAVVDVPPFAHADTGMEGDGRLDDALTVSQPNDEEGGVEVEIDGRVQHGKQPLKRLAANQFVGGPYVRECAPAKVLEFEEFANEKIAAVHECGKLGRIIPDRK